MSETVVIPERFNGPVGVGQGGYVCGVVARHIGAQARVTLRAPAPLGEPLTPTLPGGSRHHPLP